MLPGLRNHSYLKRLNLLGEEALVVRRIKTDLTLVYKIMRGHVEGLNHFLVLLMSAERGAIRLNL